LTSKWSNLTNQFTFNELAVDQFEFDESAVDQFEFDESAVDQFEFDESAFDQFAFDELGCPRVKLSPFCHCPTIIMLRSDNQRLPSKDIMIKLKLKIMIKLLFSLTQH